MQGIQSFDYKYLLEQLQKLQDAQMPGSCREYAGMITAQEEKLKEIYSNYRNAREEVAIVIKQFEEHKLAIRRLIARHKQNAKALINK